MDPKTPSFGFRRLGEELAAFGSPLASLPLRRDKGLAPRGSRGSHFRSPGNASPHTLRFKWRQFPIRFPRAGVRPHSHTPVGRDGYLGTGATISTRAGDDPLSSVTFKEEARKSRWVSTNFSLLNHFLSLATVSLQFSDKGELVWMHLKMEESCLRRFLSSSSFSSSFLGSPETSGVARRRMTTGRGAWGYPSHHLLFFYMEKCIYAYSRPRERRGLCGTPTDKTPRLLAKTPWWPLSRAIGGGHGIACVLGRDPPPRTQNLSPIDRNPYRMLGCYTRRIWRRDAATQSRRERRNFSSPICTRSCSALLGSERVKAQRKMKKRQGWTGIL